MSLITMDKSQELAKPKRGRAMDFSNVYEDSKRADAYSKLEFPGTYYLAFRDLPTIFSKHVTGKVAMDFGCGSGRSTRFLQKLGFHTVSVDISEEMVAKAREFDPEGDYRVIEEADFSQFEIGSFDLIFSAFPFDNIPTMGQKVMNLSGLRDLLKEEGRLVNLVSNPEIYTHEWASFSTKDFPKNRDAKSGDVVLIIQMDTADKRPVEDILWTHESYMETYQKSQLKVVDIYNPLGKNEEPYEWINETKIAPWLIHVLSRI
ncbi:MAG: methyltransferase domain-containing protein [Candidatus Thorarchaeota archaeon]|nr:methyltransferase domain-containing protein [Candidatus Thorarchaeota archaeon]